MSTAVSAAPRGRPARHWVADVVAGVSVGAVLIPQSMAYAELAGLPAHRGLFAGALPPLAAAFFASSPYLQTGPVALTALLSYGALASLATPGTDAYVLLAALLALIVGAVRVTIGLLRAGTVAYLMSAAVLRGFTLAAALLIFSSQLPSVLGVDAPGESVLGRAIWAAVHPSEWEIVALGLSAVTLVLMLGGRKVHALFPGVLVAVIIGVVYSNATGYSGSVVGDIPASIIPPFTLDLPWGSLPTLVVSGGIIALVGFAEAASVAQTFAEQTREEWDPNREFVSQGVANVAAGLFGGFPVGGSFSRSALNKHAGAMTRASGGVTGLTVLLALPFSALLEPLPKAILGAIVVGAVSKLLDPRPVLEIWPQSRPQAAIAAGTFLLTLALSPHVEYAVLGGIAFALAAHIWRETKVDVRETIVGDTLVLRPQGVIWFASAPLFRQALSGAIARNHEIKRVILDLGGIGRLDLTGGYALNAIADGARQAGVDFSFGEVPPPCERIVRIVCGSVPRAPNHREQQLALALPASESGGGGEGADEG